MHTYIQGWFDEYKIEKGFRQYRKIHKRWKSVKFRLFLWINFERNFNWWQEICLSVWLTSSNLEEGFWLTEWNKILHCCNVKSCGNETPKIFISEKIKRGRYDLLIQFLPLFLGNCVHHITCIFSWNRPHAEMETFTSEKTWEFP